MYNHIYKDFALPPVFVLVDWNKTQPHLAWLDPGLAQEKDDSEKSNEIIWGVKKPVWHQNTVQPECERVETIFKMSKMRPGIVLEDIHPSTRARQPKLRNYGKSCCYEIRKY